MKSIVLASILTLACTLSSAGIKVNSVCKGDSLQFQGDKQVHLGYSAGIGAATRTFIRDPWAAFGVAILPGLYREAFNSNSCFSNEDMVYNIVGAALGVASDHWIIGPGKVVFHTEW